MVFLCLLCFFLRLLWLIYGRWVQLRNFMVILRAWLLNLWLFYGFGSRAWRGK